MRLASCLGWVLLATGCFDNVETPFPPGLEPLEENLAPAPVVEGDPYPEVLSMVRMFALHAEPRTPSVHARAYVKAPIASVWAALRDPDVNADRRVFTSYEQRPAEEPPGDYDYHYLIHSVIVNIVTVEYDVTWRHGAIEGTLEEPALVAITYQKTYGSTAIQDLRGSLLLRAIEPDVTELEYIEYLRAAGSSHDNIESFLRDMYAEVLLLSHGQPLPPVTEL